MVYQGISQQEFHQGLRRGQDEAAPLSRRRFWGCQRHPCSKRGSNFWDAKGINAPREGSNHCAQACGSRHSKSENRKCVCVCLPECVRHVMSSSASRHRGALPVAPAMGRGGPRGAGGRCRPQRRSRRRTRVLFALSLSCAVVLHIGACMRICDCLQHSWLTRQSQNSRAPACSSARCASCLCLRPPSPSDPSSGIAGASHTLAQWLPPWCHRSVGWRKHSIVSHGYRLHRRTCMSLDCVPICPKWRHWLMALLGRRRHGPCFPCCGLASGGCAQTWPMPSWPCMRVQSFVVVVVGGLTP